MVLSQDIYICAFFRRSQCQMLPGSAVSAAVYLPLWQTHGMYLFPRNEAAVQATQARLQVIMLGGVSPRGWHVGATPLVPNPDPGTNLARGCGAGVV